MGFEAVGTYERTGFKNGAWWDVAWWQRDLMRYGPRTPSPPLLVADVADDVAWRTAVARGEALVRR